MCLNRLEALLWENGGSVTSLTISQQCEAMLTWVRSEAGRDAAARLVSKYGLAEEPLDLVSISSEKINALLSRRMDRIPGVDTDEDATRYAYRTMSNAAIDLGRRRRNESSALFSIAAIAPISPGTEQTVISKVFIEELFSALHHVATSGFQCGTCNDKTVYAAATEVLHLALIEGSDAAAGESWFEDVIYSVVDRYELGMSHSITAQRQRRSRCKRCVMQLLQASLKHIGVNRG